MTNKHYRIANISAIILSLVFIILQVMIVNFDSTYGEKFKTLNHELSKIKEENTILSQKIASSSAIFTIAEKAKLQGLESNILTVSLYRPQPLAQLGLSL